MLIAMVCSVKIDIIGRSSKGVKKITFLSAWQAWVAKMATCSCHNRHHRPMARAFASGGDAKKRKTTGLWSLGASFAVATQQAELGAWKSCTFMIFSYMWVRALFLKTRVLWGGVRATMGRSVRLCQARLHRLRRPWHKAAVQWRSGSRWRGHAQTRWLQMHQSDGRAPGRRLRG